MRIAFFADVDCNHGSKWINEFSLSHEVILISHPSKNNFRLYKNNPKVKIYDVLPFAFPLKNFLYRKKIISEIKYILDKHKIEVVHSMYAIPYSFWPLVAGVKNQIITTRGSDMLVQYKKEYCNPANTKERILFYFLKRIIKKALLKAAYITSTSTRQIDVIHSIIGENSKVKLIRTGVDISCFKESRAKKNVSSEKQFVIFSNRAMAPLYNIEIIIDAFELFVNDNPGIKPLLMLLDYYGDAAYKQKILKIIDSKGLRSLIEILPDQNLEGLIELYKKSDVVVMIPKSDGTPVTGIETLLSKRPLIVGNLDYDSDLFNEKTIWKLSSFSPEELNNKLKIVYETSEEEKNARVERGFGAANSMADMHKEIKKIEGLYQNVIKK